MRKKELVEKVAGKTGLKRKDVRSAVDAAFEVLREELAAGREVAVPPLGKVKVKVQGEGAEAKTIYRLKLASEAEVAADRAAAETE